MKKLTILTAIFFIFFLSYTFPQPTFPITNNNKSQKEPKYIKSFNIKYKKQSYKNKFHKKSFNPIPMLALYCILTAFQLALSLR